MTIKRILMGALGFAFAAVAGTAANAGVITNISVVCAGCGFSGGGALITPAPNNDDPQGTSQNIIDLSKEFTNMEPIDLVFDVRNSDGTTEYQFLEDVQNSSGQGWTDFHLELGFGTGINFVGSLDFDFLDFDQPFPQNPAATNTNFATIDVQANPDTIWFLDGFLANGANMSLSTPLDVPDSDFPGAIPAAFVKADGSGYIFTIRQLPTRVPEPGTLGLLGLGLAGLGLMRRRRKALA